MENKKLSLGHYPTSEKWSFDEGVTEVFDDMLSRSIPQYELMREIVYNLATRYIQEGTEIIDLGCSRGEAMAKLIDRYGAHNHFTGIEISQAMLEASRNRFKGWIKAGVVDIKDLDLRYEYPPRMASLTLSILTLQFTPIEYRQKILSEIYKHTLPGGAFILVEKVLGSTAEIDKALVDEYHKLKKSNGYSFEEIERKKLSLEGVLVPVTAKWNEELLRNAGFQEVDCFWRYMNFAGWIGIKK